MAKILIVEDDVDVAFAMKKGLMKAGYSVLVCNDGVQGIQMVLAYKPDLILMDIMLETMNGDEAVRILKRQPECLGIPVVFLTGLLSNADGKDGKGSIMVDGANYVSLAKPFNMPALLKVVADHTPAK